MILHFLIYERLPDDKLSNSSK